MNFAKLIFSMLLFMIGFMIGVTEIFALLVPHQRLTLGDANIQPLWMAHAAYLLGTISCLGTSFLLLKNFNKTELILK